MEKTTGEHYINGEFVHYSTSEYFDDIGPNTEDIIAHFPSADSDAISETVDSAEDAQVKWESITGIERAKLLRKVSQKIRADANRLAKVITLEQGKTQQLSLREVNNAANYIDYMSEWARRVEGEIIQSDRKNENIFIYNQPIGVVVAIIPWNSPFFIFARKMAPALMAGNSIVIKPSSETPLTAYEFTRILSEIDFPHGIVNVIYGGGEKIGNELISNKKVGFVTFTGSTVAGADIMKAASQNITKISLELGGKAPAIVMEDADLEIAVESIYRSRMFNNGQVCNAAERVYVQKNILDKFINAMRYRMEKTRIGNSIDDPSIDNGPLVSQKQRERVYKLVTEATNSGDKLLLGGNKIKIGGKGWFFEPTLILSETNKSNIMRDEIFGPVLPILSFEDFSEAIDFANDTDMGLTSSIYTQNLNVAMKAVHELKFGETYINRENGEEMQGYHSGWKKSGLGGDDGKHGFEEYFNKHVVYLQYS